MANFVSRSVVKSAVRTLSTEIPTVAAFIEVVDYILTTNPYGCTDHEVAGVSHDGTEKTRESYTARFAYENLEAETIGTPSVKCETAAAFNGVVTAVPAATAINTAIGATAVHVSDDDTFSVAIRCHDANGELYSVAVTRSAVTVSGYEADGVPALV